MPIRELNVHGETIPLTTADVVIVGSGAAVMACAARLGRAFQARGEPVADRVCVVTAGLPLGASRMSGSDKQTYYKQGTNPRAADSALEMARVLTAGGACHGDTALIEAAGSLRAFHFLVEAGVPFPQDDGGAFVGYQTDNDPAGRATSAGPRTSRMMARALEALVRAAGVPILDKHVVLDFLTEGEGPGRRIVGMLCQDLAHAKGNRLGLAAFAARRWVLAGGGPGELYKSSVYPKGQYGFHGAALEAGLHAENLTESQYGLAALKFRWNVSGSYMQAIPRIFSTDPAGADAREFLTDCFADTSALSTAIFLKGYQWPFDAARIAGGGSSLIDMAVHQETAVRGRRVWMDFLANPRGRGAFDLATVGAEAREYLRKAGACQALPIERLSTMNAPAIEIFAENGVYLEREPLEIALCAQHMNGGMSVNAWWESNVPDVFVIGEMAGTHGVRRPGGAALNAGQVGAARAAEWIANTGAGGEADALERQAGFEAELGRGVAGLKEMMGKGAEGIGEAMEEIRERMTRHGAHLRSLAGARGALAEAVGQYKRICAGGLRVEEAREVGEAVRARQQCLTQAAVLKAVCGMLERGSGSRGSHLVLEEAGLPLHPGLVDPRTGREYRMKGEAQGLRDHVLRLAYNPEAAELFDLFDDAPRPMPSREAAFEVWWREFREGRRYER